MNETRAIKTLVDNDGGAILYAIFESEERILPGKSCVMFEMSQKGAGTVLGAEKFVEAVLAAEKVKLEEISFYDLKAPRRTAHWHPSYTFERLEFKNSDSLWVERWKPEYCPLAVAQAFERVVGSPHVERPVIWVQ